MHSPHKIEQVLRAVLERMLLPKHQNWLFIGFLIMAYVVIAVMGGPDVGWDIKNYHFYVGHNFWRQGLTGTMRPQDVFPAQVQGWFNPLLDALYIGLIENMPPMLATAIAALLQSLALPLLYLLIKQVAPEPADLTLRKNIQVMRGAAMIIAAFGAMTLSEIGTSFSDFLAALPVLAALVALGQGACTKNAKWYAVAGFCFGAAVGLKLTMLIFTPGFLVAFLGASAKFKYVPKHLVVLGAGACAGLLVFDGFWLWHMAAMTGNPFFPAVNGLFHSNWSGAAGNLLDTRFRADGVDKIMGFVVALAQGRHPGAEIDYNDWRFVLTFAALPLALYAAARNKLKAWPLALVACFYVSFFVWIYVFGIMRYAVLLEILSGIVFLVLIQACVPQRYAAPLLAITTLLLCLTTRPPQWIPHIGWGSVKSDNWFAVAVPEALQNSDQMFLMLSGEPTSYAIPFLPPDSAFVRMEGNFNPQPDSVLYQQRLEHIAGHKGAFWSFGVTSPNPVQQELLASYGFIGANGPCQLITTNMETLYACPLMPK